MSELTKTSSSNAVATTSNISQDAPTRSLNRQVILEEDEYTTALSHIIARDFFPSLVHLDAANNYLDALRTEDPELIGASVRQLQTLQGTPSVSGRASVNAGRRTMMPLATPSQTPWAAGPSDTPYNYNTGRAVDDSDDVDAEPAAKRARIEAAASLSLDAFQAQFTSEDNASFTQILDDENKARQARYGWAWDAQRRVEAQRVKALEARERLLIGPLEPEPGVRERKVLEAPKTKGLLTAGTEVGEESGGESGEGKEVAVVEEQKEVAVVVIESNKESGEEEKVVDVLARKKDKRPAGVDGWNFKTRNALMFPPDADSAPYNTATTTKLPARGEPKSIKYANTRLPEQSEGPSSSSVSEPPSPTRSRIDAAIAGTPYHPRSPSNKGFGLLPAVPSPTPEQLGPAAVKQLMTWGTLGATPRILSSSSLADPAEDVPITSTPFHLPPPTARETMSHKLSSSASRSLRAKAAMMGGGFGLGGSGGGGNRRGSMPPPSWTPGGQTPRTPRKVDAVGTLTPAARRLLDRSTASVAGARRADAMGKTAGWQGRGTGKTAAKDSEKERDLNRVRWTPSPAPVSRRR